MHQCGPEKCRSMPATYCEAMLNCLQWSSMYKWIHTNAAGWHRPVSWQAKQAERQKSVKIWFFTSSLHEDTIPSTRKNAMSLSPPFKLELADLGEAVSTAIATSPAFGTYRVKVLDPRQHYSINCKYLLHCRYLKHWCELFTRDLYLIAIDPSGTIAFPHLTLEIAPKRRRVSESPNI